MLGFFRKKQSAEEKFEDKPERVRPMSDMEAVSRPSFAKAAEGKPAASTKAMLAKVDLSTFSKLINFCLLALVFLVPLLFLPTSSEVREFNKQALLFLGVMVMLGVWVVRVLTTRTVSWVKTSLDYIVLALLFTSLLSSLFSLDKASSFLGYYGRFTGSFISVLSLVVLYFLVVNNLRSGQLAQKMSKYLTASFFVVLAYSFLQLLGLYLLPFEFAKSRSFNPIGSLVGLSIFPALTVLWPLGLWMSHKPLSRRQTIFYTVMLILGLAVMFLVNAFVAWLILGLGTIVFLAVGMSMTAHEPQTNWFWKPMVVLVLAILFIGFQFLPQSLNPRNVVTVDLPVEIQLSNATTFSLVKNSLSSGGKQAVLGYGPGTTGLAFGDIKPEALNKTVVWNLNFDRASSEFANLAIENGLLGLLVFELMAILFLIYGLYFLFKKHDHPGRMQAFGFFVLWLGLYLAHFFYFFNTSFYFLYWLALAAFMAIAHWSDSPPWNKGELEGVISENSASLSLAASPRAALSWMFASLLMLAVLLVGAFFEVAVYAAEAQYVSGVRAVNAANPDFQKAAERFARAANLNPYRDVYLQALGQDLIFLSSQEAAKDEPNVAQVQNWLASSVNAGLAATRISPAKAANWSALAQFYQNIKPLGIAGTDQAIINAWQEAANRDSKNPALLIRLANAYSDASEVLDPKIAGSGADTDQDGLADNMEESLGSNPELADSNQNGVMDGDEVKAGFNPAGAGRLSAAALAQFTKIDQTKLAEAQKILNRAIELKSDLPDSYIASSRIYEKSKQLAEARKKIDEAAEKFPQNSDVRFEQGRIAYNQKDYVQAESIFSAVVKLTPNHANAHYSLGLVYQQRGDDVRALAEFEKTRAITGPNVELEKLINSLKNE